MVKISIVNRLPADAMPDPRMKMITGQDVEYADSGFWSLTGTLEPVAFAIKRVEGVSTVVGSIYADPATHVGVDDDTARISAMITPLGNDSLEEAKLILAVAARYGIVITLQDALELAARDHENDFIEISQDGGDFVKMEAIGLTIRGLLQR